MLETKTFLLENERIGLLSGKVGQRLIQPVSKPQISNTVAFRIAPNAKDQAFHRDDNVHHT